MTTEKEDADAMRLRCNEMKLLAFETMRMLVNMSQESLKSSGHASLGAALEWTMHNTMAKIVKEHKEFLKKWPD